MRSIGRAAERGGFAHHPDKEEGRPLLGPPLVSALSRAAVAPLAHLCATTATQDGGDIDGESGARRGETRAHTEEGTL